MFYNPYVQLTGGHLDGGCQQKSSGSPGSSDHSDGLHGTFHRYPSQRVVEVEASAIRGLDGGGGCFQRIIFHQVQVMEEAVSVGRLCNIHEELGKRAPT